MYKIKMYISTRDMYGGVTSMFSVLISLV